MALVLYFIVSITTIVLFDYQIRCTERIRIRYTKVVTDKHFPRYRSSNMPKFDILEAIAGRKDSGCEMYFWRHSGHKNNGIILLFIRQFWTHGMQEKNNKISLNSFEKYIWALYANRSVSCIFSRGSGLWI